jgi:iron complex transport system substrate-binding protein
MNHSVRTLLLLTLILLLTAACSNTADAEPEQHEQELNQAENEQQAGAEADPEAEHSEAEHEADQQSGAEYIIDEDLVAGLLQQFQDQSVERAVVMSVSLTELYDIIGVTPVGVPTSSSVLPAAFDEIPRVGNSHQPDLEFIAGLLPDLILGPASLQDSMNRIFAAASLPTAYLPADSLDELKRSLLTLGRLYNKEQEALDYINHFQQKEQAIIEQSAGKEAPRVLILFGSTQSLMFMNEQTYVGSLVHNLGAVNVVSDVLQLTEAYVALDLEQVVEANPDIILLVAHGDANAVAEQFKLEVQSSGAWESLDAVQNDQLIALDYGLFGIASLPKALDAYEELARILFD